MKTRLLLLVSLLVAGLTGVQAQIVDCYSQDFESGSPATYSANSSAVSTQSSIVYGGSSALKMTHTQGSNVIVTLDTIDLSNYSGLEHFVFDFRHIAFVNALYCNPRTETCVIDYKLASDSIWHRLSRQYYNMEEGGSNEFFSLSSFSVQSYSDWNNSTSVSNAL